MKQSATKTIPSAASRKPWAPVCDQHQSRLFFLCILKRLAATNFDRRPLEVLLRHRLNFNLFAIVDIRGRGEVAASVASSVRPGLYRPVFRVNPSMIFKETHMHVFVKGA